MEQMCDGGGVWWWVALLVIYRCVIHGRYFIIKYNIRFSFSFTPSKYTMPRSLFYYPRFVPPLLHRTASLATPRSCFSRRTRRRLAAPRWRGRGNGRRLAAFIRERKAFRLRL